MLTRYSFIVLHALVALATVGLTTSPVLAQEISAGSTATVAGGEVGKRQTREDAPSNIKPMGRLMSRIQSRVQSRIRNRIDDNYDPKANTTSPFKAASEQARKAGKTPPR